MLLSMTGYGRVRVPFKEKTIVVEVRSLNSKYTDLRLKLPQNYREKEADIRKMITDAAERGKIDFSMEMQSVHGGDEEFSLNVPLFKKYYEELQKLRSLYKDEQADLFQSIMRLPNVVVSTGDELDEKEWAAVRDAIQSALTNFTEFRLEEGKMMEKDMAERIKTIEELALQLPPFEEARMEKMRQRLYQNLEEYLGKDKVDENRFEQEVLFYMEKMDITEEKVRLAQHCKYFLEELDNKKSLKGRKLSFISQEIGREVNTLGAKAYSSDIQRLVVSMKDELEKIKEQVANAL